MDNDHPERIGDLIFIALLIPFCLWLGAWGILPSLLVGGVANFFEEKAYDRKNK